MRRASALLPHVSASSACAALARPNLRLFGWQRTTPESRARPLRGPRAPPALPGVPRRVLSNFPPLMPPQRGGTHRLRSAPSPHNPVLSNPPPFNSPFRQHAKDWLLGSPSLCPLLPSIEFYSIVYYLKGGRRPGAERGVWGLETGGRGQSERGMA